jgi:DNA-binding NarL/FixJ family response regulator
LDLQPDGGMDGVTGTRRLTQDGGSVPRVLVLTMFVTDADVTRAVEAGAAGCLRKAEQPDELFTAMRNAASGRTALSAPVTDRLLARLRSPAPALSPREHEILAQLARGQGNREIARALFVSEATVKTHLGRLCGKLGVDTPAGAVAVAKGKRLLT